MRRLGVRGVSPLFFESGNAILEEGNWENLRTGMPGNLQLLEGFLYTDQNNSSLLATLVKGYAGYAYGVSETLFLGDQLAEIEKEDSLHYRQTIEGYSRALKYGFRYFKIKDFSEQELVSAEKKVTGGIPAFLDRKLGGDIQDIETVFFTAQALGGLINLNRQDIALTANLSLVKEMFDWACKKRPLLHFGACSIFYGSYETGRPRMLGGNPEKGKIIFEKLIKDHPYNYAARTAFIEHYIIPMGKEKLYQEQKEFLNKAAKCYRHKQSWQGRKDEDPCNRRKQRFFQAVGLKRFELFKKNEKNLF